tara:strand:- start:549 stop:1274 length:726 start_codon:yes stop_codon:yes gene_type:complete
MIDLYKGDCLEVMKEIESGSIDAIICDLPYGTTQNKWDSVIDLDKLWAEYWRVLKKTGVAVLTASQPFSSALLMSQKKYFKHEWIWIKNRGGNFANTVREPMKEHEQVLIFSKGKWTYNKQMQERNGSGKDRVKYNFNKRAETTNYGNIHNPKKRQSELRGPCSHQKFNTETGLHPTQKPVALMEYLIKTYTNEGDTVLDNTMGSGTTGEACKRLNRNFIGIEQDEKYFNIASERINGTLF